MENKHICSFTTNYEYNENIKYNVIVFTFFRLENMYKKMDVYLEGVVGFHDYLLTRDTLEHNIKIRIYYDKSIYNTNDKLELEKIKTVFNKLQKNKYFQLFEFECSNYKKKKTPYHRSIFPFFIRYFPFFNFVNNDTNFIYVIDIDVTEKKNNNYYYEYIINIFIDKIIKKNTNFFFSTSKCYIPFWKRHFWKRDHSKKDYIVVIGNGVGGNFKIPDTLLRLFLDKCENYPKSGDLLLQKFYKNYIKYIKNSKIPYEYRIKKKVTYDIDNIFVYGLDELFLTYYLLPFILSNKKVDTIYEHTRNVSSGGLYNLIYNLIKPFLESKNNSVQTLRIYTDLLYYVTKKRYTKENIVSEFKKFIEQFKNHDYDGNTKKEYFYNRFYKGFFDMVKKNNSDIDVLKIDPRELRCFCQNDKYYTDKNNIIEINKKIRENYLNDLTNTITSSKN